MKVIAQIDENKFVVEMEEIDNDHGDSIFVAHDYFSLSGTAFIRCKAGLSIQNPIREWSEHSLPVRVNLHVSIREMIELVMPYLQSHPMMQPERLLKREDGTNPYMYMSTDLTLYDGNEVKKIDGELIEKVVRKHYTRKASLRMQDVHGYNVEEIVKTYHLSPYKEDNEETREYEIPVKL